MRTILTLSILVISFLACKNENTEEGNVLPAGMQWFDLKRFGKPFSIAVPDTNANPIDATEKPDGSLQLVSGKHFAISINEGACDLALKKSDIQADEVNKLTSIHHSDASTMVWESSITGPEFHMMAVKKIGPAEYCFEDVRETAFSKNDIEAMLQSCGSTKVSGESH